MWLFTIIRRMATPPLINLIAELICISSILSLSDYNLLWIILAIFLAGSYSILLYSRTQQSSFFNLTSFLTISTAMESIIFFNHLVWVLLLALRLNIFVI